MQKIHKKHVSLLKPKCDDCYSDENHTVVPEAYGHKVIQKCNSLKGVLCVYLFSCGKF